jgi:hypothetical protein
MLTQAGFLGHDAAHRQIPGCRRASHIPGNLPDNPGTGLSYGWRAGQHRRHRAHQIPAARTEPAHLPPLTLAPA